MRDQDTQEYEYITKLSVIKQTLSRDTALWIFISCDIHSLFVKYKLDVKRSIIYIKNKKLTLNARISSSSTHFLSWELIL